MVRSARLNAEMGAALGRLHRLHFGLRIVDEASPVAVDAAEDKRSRAARRLLLPKGDGDAVLAPTLERWMITFGHDGIPSVLRRLPKHAFAVESSSTATRPVRLRPAGMPLLTAREVAGWLAVSTETVLRWTRGVLPGFRLPGGALRYREADIAEWLADRATAGND